MKISAVFAIAVVLSVVPLRANNLVRNSGFETGDFTSWTVDLAPEDFSELVVSPPSNSGSFSAGFGATLVGSYDSISQNLETVNGQSYLLGFFVANNFSSGDDLLPSQTTIRTASALDPVGDFQVFWDGTLVLDLPAGAQSTLGFTQFAFQVQGTGSDALTFRGYNVPSFFRLDDVSVDVAAAPEPATWSAMGIALAGLLGIRKIRRT